jgi:hypothetical protein
LSFYVGLLSRGCYDGIAGHHGVIIDVFYFLKLLLNFYLLLTRSHPDLVVTSDMITHALLLLHLLEEVHKLVLLFLGLEHVGVDSPSSLELVVLTNIGGIIISTVDLVGWSFLI